MKPHENQNFLAPASGIGIGRSMFAKLLSRPDLADLLATAALDGLQAMTPRRWDKNADDGRGAWVSDPDYRVRTQTLFALLAQAEGEPVKRVHVQTQSTTVPSDDIVTELANNPAARQAMKRILENAEAGARKAERVTRAAKPPEDPTMN